MKSGVLLFLLTITAFASPSADPYSALSDQQKIIIKPLVTRWVHDQIKQNWKDLWEIQDQTSDLKNELLFDRSAPDMDQKRYVEAMRGTMNSGYWVIQNFTLREIRIEKDGFWIIGCGKLQREAWRHTNITDVHIRMVNGKPMFGLPGQSGEPCTL